jgi:hypothetical protein
MQNPPIQPQAQTVLPSQNSPQLQPQVQAALTAAALQQPVDPATPEDLPPAVPPVVTYENGLLSISAENCTLASILFAVRAQTDAQINVPAGTVNERVATNFGPAPMREVLVALLNGSGYNYVLMGTLEQPDSIQRVLLTPRPKKPETLRAKANVVRAPQPPAPEASQEALDISENSPDVAEGEQQVVPVAEAGSQPAQVEIPGMPGVKTPEQLLDALQNLQNQQQQSQPQDSQQKPVSAQHAPSSRPQ